MCVCVRVGVRVVGEDGEIVPRDVRELLVKRLVNALYARLGRVKDDSIAGLCVDSPVIIRGVGTTFPDTDPSAMMSSAFL